MGVQVAAGTSTFSFAEMDAHWMTTTYSATCSGPPRKPLVCTEGFGMHVLRRLSVTWRQTIGGAAPVEAQKQAGYTSLDMTMLYSQTDEDRERERVSKILDHLG